MLKKIRIAIWAIAAGVALFTFYAYNKVSNMDSRPMALSDTPTPTAEKSDTPQFMPIAGLNPEGDFTLTDHTGATFTQDSPAWQAAYKLIYFGFTFCPSICPTELQKMTQAINALPADKADKIQPIFITIDPERDDVDAMNKYVSLFHQRFIGLTGTPAQINHMKDMWKVYAAKVEDESMSEYTMDHSSYIYLQGPGGEILGLFRIKDSAADITKYLAKTIP